MKSIKIEIILVIVTIFAGFAANVSFAKNYGNGIGKFAYPTAYPTSYPTPNPTPYPNPTTKIIYVKLNARGSNSGTTWINAYTSLQSALSAASKGDQIWVAKGTYKPTTGTDNSISFTLKQGVAIYGGFSGKESLHTQRNPAINITILSGDINEVGNMLDNSFNVITADGINGGTILDGLTISGGHARGSSSPHNSGGGLYNTDSGPTITNVIFDGNYGIYGGGMYNGNGSIPLLTNVTFKNNSAGAGGGMYNENNSNAQLEGVFFNGNRSFDKGGGMANIASKPSLYMVTFINNGSDGWAGGMYNENSDPFLDGIIFKNNFAGVGGGILNNSSDPYIINTTFDSNTAVDGGGIYNISGRPFIQNSTFYNNQAKNQVGVQDLGSGGGIFNSSGDLELTHVTISGNFAGVGPGIYNSDGSSSTIQNSIVWENSSPQIDQISGQGTSTVTYSVVQGGFAGTGNLSSNPLLGALTNNGGFTQTIPLLPGSPAIDSGDDTSCPADDQRGLARPQGEHCDIGAFEYTDPPFVSTITRANSTPTAATSVIFKVTFSENVTGVDVNDFSLATSGVSGAAMTKIRGSGSVYMVTVNTGSGTGVIRLDVVDNNTIVDEASNPLGGADIGDGDFTGGEIYYIKKLLPLTVIKTGTGSGTVTSNPRGIHCGSDCSETYDYNSSISLTAIADSGSTFTGWSGGGCSGIGTCIVSMNLARSISAGFSLNPPEPFSKSNPANGLIDQLPSLTLSWGSSSGATSYEYCYDKTNNNACATWVNNGVSTTKLLSGLIHGTTYYWHVRAKNAGGVTYSDASPTAFWSFKIGSLPSAPLLISPVTNTFTLDNTPSFKWNSAANGITYEIQIDDSAAFKAPIIQSHLGASGELSYVASALPDKAYYWRVRAYNLNNEPGAWSALRKITIDTSAPLPPVLKAPINAASVRGTPKYSWVASSTAYRYQFEYDNDDSFSSPNYSSLELTTLTHKPPTQALGTFYWHVRARDAAGNWSPWSLPRIINILP